MHLLLVRDIFAFTALTVSLALLMAKVWWMVWFLLICVVCRLGSQSSKKSTFESRWLNWFEIAKLLGALAGIAAISAFQYSCPALSQSWHTLCSVLLVINIGEAVARDCQSGLMFLGNAFCGIVLLLKLPHFDPQIIGGQGSGLLEYPLSWSWIGMYTSWNACFTYGFNLSWSTRFQLSSAIFLAVLFFDGNSACWLHVRTLTLTLNMILRAVQFTYLFTPGASMMTFSGKASHNPSIYRVWGIANCLAAASILFLGPPRTHMHTQSTQSTSFTIVSHTHTTHTTQNVCNI
jgi:hypothetical protein